MRRTLAGLMVCAFLVAACSDGSEVATGGTGTRSSASGEHADLTVSAASSLTEAFTDIGRAFEEENPGVTVRFNFGPSDTLAQQINEGAPVDVFASASPAWMDSVQDDGSGVSGRADFAKNRLAIVVPADDPASVRSLGDLAKPGVKLVLAAEGVPAGDYARLALRNAGISDAALANLVSNEEDVKAVIAKVLAGDADAGIVYVTDVTPDLADRIALIRIPDDVNVIATYPIAVVSGSKEADLAQRFVDFVLGANGQQILASHGFLPA